ncbi:hypothetical protein A4A49_21890 [Nicotiana attenuata]|uniref:Uncharacterized protein n=1 Tax=Nicotiana attenuata TaxID=49451 RepID=A0A1J6IH26_NICAT|nr:hypothetical protein A4A49_21890 [Nicotiana attenuata]
MEPPDGAASARLGCQPNPSNTAIQPSDPINTKLAYATKVISSSNAPTPSNCHGREAVITTHTMHNCMPTVLFKAMDYYGVMAEECKLTIVGRSSSQGSKLTKLDFTNEDDFNFVWFRRVIEIEGQHMWLQKWSPDFKPEEDLPIAPIWVLLPGLAFHMHTWIYVKQVVRAIGTPLEMDLATKGRTRPSMAKVKVEIDLLKDQPNSVYVGQTYDNAPQKDFVQKIEYEGVPKYSNTALNRGIGTEHAVKQSEHAENQNEATKIDQNMKLLNRGMRDRTAEFAFNKEAAKQIDQKRGIEPAESATVVNTGQTENRTTPRRKKYNKELSLALQNLNQNITIENDMNAQGQPKEDEQRDQAKASNDHAKVVKGQTKAVSEQLSSRTKLHRDMQEDTENRATKEDMQKSIRENVSQNVKRDTENKKMQKSVLNISDYVNESTSVPSEIRNLPGIEMVVDLNMDSKSKQERYVTSQQIEVTSPNRVTVMVPEDQIQTDSKDESFQIICSKKGKGK